MFYGYGDAIKDWEAYDARRSSDEEGHYCTKCGRFIPDGEERYDDDDNLICDDCSIENMIADMTDEERDNFYQSNRACLATI
jgi:hypothetical protein